MKIDLKQLQHQEQKSAAYSFRQAGDDELLSGLGCRFVEPVQVDLDVRETGQIMVGHGSVRTVLELPCSRCLKPVIFPLEEELAIAMLDGDVESTGQLQDDILVAQQGEVDIRPNVDEAVFSCIPLSPLCSRECRGLCPNCGVNLNEEPCRCTEEPIDPRWEALKKLT